MPCFSQDQLSDLAQHFHDLSAEVGQDRLDLIRAGADPTDQKIVDLLTSQFNLLRISSNIAVKAAGVVLDDADQAANAISVATQTADGALNKLKEIDKIVNIASAAIDLATAIYTGDINQIAAAGKTLINASSAPTSA